MNIKISDRKSLPHDLLLTIRQKTKLRNVFENNMSTDIKLSKSQISKIIQSGGFLGSFLSKLAGSLMKVAVPLAKHILAPLRITDAGSAIDAGIQKKIHGSDRLSDSALQVKILTIWNKQMDDIKLNLDWIHWNVNRHVLIL